MRFLAGICRHDDYHSHHVYQELVQELGDNQLFNIGLQLVHCAYECPSIMDSVKVDYSERDTVYIQPWVGFDLYVTGYCISHFDEGWGLGIDDSSEIDLLVKGVRSSPVVKGMIWHLDLGLESFSFSQIITQIREFCGLDCLKILLEDLYVVSDDDEVILQQLIAPWSALRRLEYIGGDGTNDKLNFISLMFQPSSLQVLDLDVGHEDIVFHELLPHKNTNLKVLKISSNFLRPLAALIVNITSLIYLEINNDTKDYPETSGPLDSDLPVLTNIVQSHRTLEELHVYIDNKRIRRGEKRYIDRVASPNAYIVCGCVVVACHSLIHEVSIPLIDCYQQPQSVGAG